MTQDETEDLEVEIRREMEAGKNGLNGKKKKEKSKRRGKSGRRK